jgi:hypothetical protein
MYAIFRQNKEAARRREAAVKFAIRRGDMARALLTFLKGKEAQKTILHFIVLHKQLFQNLSIKKGV